MPGPLAPEELSQAERHFEQLVAAVDDYAIFLLDSRGLVLTWNQGAERIKGYAAEEVIGRHFSIFYTAEAIDSGWPETELRLAAENGRLEDEGWRLRKNGSQFWASVVITALRDSSGEIRGFLKITRDLMKRKDTEQALRLSEERFRLLLEGVKDCSIVMLDPEGYITTWNEGARAISGFRVDEVLGRHFSCFYTEEARRRGWPQHELEIARAAGRFEDEGWRVRRDGSLFWANVVITPLLDSRDQPYGFAKVTRDLTERRKAEESLRRAHAALEDRVQQRTAELARVNMELADADRRKDEFIATLAHELRNPLAPVCNSLELMRLAGHDAATTARAREVIERQVQHMVRYIDDLLDVSKISHNVLELRKERVELAAVVQRALENVGPLIETLGHQLTVALPPAPVFVEADPIRLSQVFTNLLHNAAKYTARSGHIRLEAERDRAEVVVRVEDDGIGIPEELLGRVFDMFTRGDRSLERSKGGLGIGLTLVKRLTEMHGGRVEAHSAGPGRGSVFVVRLPLAAEAPGAEPESEDSESPTAPRPRRILIADDNEDSATSLATILELMGNEVSVAHDGSMAFDVAKRFRPEIAVLDIGMPRMSGYEVAERVRQQEWGRSMVLIALTGWGQEQDRHRARTAGFDHHLVKPVAPSDLMELVTRLAQPAAG